MVAMAPNGSFRKFDVKTYNFENTSGRSRSDNQKTLGVEHIWFEPTTRALGFTVKEVRARAKERKESSKYFKGQDED